MILDSYVSSDNDSLYIKYYKLVRTDYHGNVERNGVFIQFKAFLPVRCLPNPYLKGCLICHVSINNRRDYVVSLYRSPSQVSDDFNSVSTNFILKRVLY